MYTMELTANVQDLTINDDIMLVSGSVGIYTCHFNFSEEWEGFTRTAVFRQNRVELKEELLDDDSCEIPAAVVDEPGVLQIGVYGVKDNNTKIMPTKWARVKVIEEGAYL